MSGATSRTSAVASGQVSAGTSLFGTPAEPACPYCGSLTWTLGRYGRVTHKEDCPHRSDPWSQTYPEREDA